MRSISLHVLLEWWRLRFIVAVAVLFSTYPHGGTCQTVPLEPEDSRPAREAILVYHCAFDETTDIDWNHWPDGWTRKRGKGFPSYVTIQMEPIPEPGQRPQRDRKLVVRMDGGNAALYSPPIALSSSFSYLLSSRLYLEQMEGFDVRVVLNTFDRAGQSRQRYVASPQPLPGRWQTVTLGPWTLDEPDVHSATIGLEIESMRPDALFGAVQWDDIRLWALPRMQLEVDRRLPFYYEGERPVVHGRLWGLSTEQTLVRLAVFDVSGHRVHQETLPLTLAAESGMVPMTAGEDATTYSGSFRWDFPIHALGYYRIVAQVCDRSEKPLLSRELALALLYPLGGKPGGGSFGWAFPASSHNLEIRDIPDMATWAGLRWVKFPVWFDEKQGARGDELAWLAERLATRGIELVGLLDQPPLAARSQLARDGSALPIALVFRDPELWQNWLSPVMTRLSLRVRWWQLGGDRDYSYAGYAQTEPEVLAVKKFFERFGQEPHLVLPWNWLEEPPGSRQPPWDHLSFGTQPTLTAEELAGYLEALEGPSRSPWVLIEPLGESYPLSVRASELVRCMVTALQSGAGAVFVPDPCDDERGLIERQGAPRPLFLPWYTTTKLLRGLDHRGALSLPNRSVNHVFAGPERLVIVLWNERPVRETLFFGSENDVKIVDIWGRPSKPAEQGAVAGRIEVPVGEEPIFVVAAPTPAVAWQLQTHLDKRQLRTGLGQEQTLQIRFRNTFAQGVSGQLAVHAPSSWIVQPQTVRFLAAPGEEVVVPVRVLLRATAASGEQPLDLDFEVQAASLHAFRVHQSVQVGEEEVAVRLYPAWNDAGDLVLEQEFHNLSSQTVSFNCVLFVPGKGRFRRQVLYLGPGRRVDYYVVPGGESLRGQAVWLRASEIGGKGRILNYELFLPQ
ncbi:MAG: hypothetical protein KatS3mg110_2026 [Pirellulaceae bacterium]|nr:MAG: hypothetical protein KatS3mg110_2026 [Pirellulaceae bacterium]